MGHLSEDKTLSVTIVSSSQSTTFMQHVRKMDRENVSYNIFITVISPAVERTISHFPEMTGFEECSMKFMGNRFWTDTIEYFKPCMVNL